MSYIYLLVLFFEATWSWLWYTVADV